MRLLLPVTCEPVNLAEAYSRDVQEPKGRPFVRVNMVSSLDGAVAVSGRSGPLGGPGDRLVFAALRSLADFILVGAGTLRAEHYGPPSLPEEVQQFRETRGQSRLPRLAVVTGSARLDWGSPLFSGRDQKTVVITSATAGRGELKRASEVAEVLSLGRGTVDLVGAVQALGALGARHVLCEGGPRLNTSLLAAGLIDELCLTLSPKLAGPVGPSLMSGWLGGSGPQAVAGPSGGSTPELGTRARPQPLQLELVHVLEEHGFLFLRLRASSEQPSGPTLGVPSGQASSALKFQGVPADKRAWP
ncbi:MAG: pyrimidine reductase family protein [Acidimicrobiales bacterium]